MKSKILLTTITLSAGIFIGSLNSFFSEDYKTMMPDTSRLISLDSARHFYQSYHRLKSLDGTRFISGGDTVESFYLSKEVILSLELKAAQEDELLDGFMGVPVYNSLNVNSIMWLGVTRTGSSTHQYFVPEDSTDFIFDYIDVCPRICPTNQNALFPK